MGELFEPGQLGFPTGEPTTDKLQTIENSVTTRLVFADYLADQGRVAAEREIRHTEFVRTDSVRRNGYGTGYGTGNGNGDGNGYGYGYGDGNGYGYGDGNGNGNGDGYRDGNGYGDG